MPVKLTEGEIKTFNKNGVDIDSIKFSVDFHRSNGLSDDEIRARIDTKLNEYYNKYTSSHLQPTIKGSLSYNDILSNNNLSREQKAELIQKRGESYRRELDNDLRKQKTSNIAGNSVKILSPLAGLIPFVGLPVAGAVYGLGDAIEHKNDFKTTLGKMGLYAGASYLGGNVGGKAVNALPSLKNKIADTIVKTGLKGGSLGGADGLAEGLNQSFNSKRFKPDEILAYTFNGALGGSALGSAGGALSAKSTKTAKPDFSKNEKLRDFLREGISKRRAYEDSNIYEATNIINEFIDWSKDFAKRYNINDKQVRELVPFIREQSGLPSRNFDRKDLISLYNLMSNSAKNELNIFAGITSSKLEKFWNKYRDIVPTASKVNEEKYVPHIWKKTTGDYKKSLNFFKDESKFANQRAFNTYKAGIEGIKQPNGEIISFTPETLDYAEILKKHSDDVIRATSNSKFIKGLMKIQTPDKLPILSNVGGSSYISVKHPSLGTKHFIHKDYKDILLPVFETPKTKTRIGNLFDSVNNFAKTCKFLLNGMHSVALTETASAHEGIIPIKTLKTLTNIPKIIDGIKNNNYELFKKTPLAKQAINDGVQFGSISDLNIKEFTSNLDSILNFLDKSTFGASKVLTKPLKASMKFNNDVLWNYLHNTYKLHAYETLINRVQKQNKAPISKEVRREIGQIVNDTFGGQNWDTLGIKPSTVQASRRLLLSPDWNMSAFIRQSLSVFSSEISQKTLNNLAYKSESGAFLREFTRKMGLSSFTNDVKAAGVRGQLARQFFFRFIIQSAIYANMVNFAARSFDKLKNPDLYKNDTSDFNLYKNNRFNENDSKLTKLTDTLFPRPFVGRSENGREKYARISKQAREVPEFVEDGIEGAVRKTASKTSPLVSPIATYVADKLTNGWNTESIKDRYKKTFTPFSLSNSEITPLSAVYSTTKGINFYQAKDYVKSCLGNDDIESINKISSKLEKNKINPTAVISKASGELMLEAMLNNDTEAIGNIWENLEKFNIDGYKVYKSAIYKYLEATQGGENSGKLQ